MFQRAAAQLPGKGFYMDVATTSAFTIVVNQITTGLGATGSGPSRLAIDTGQLWASRRLRTGRSEWRSRAPEPEVGLRRLLLGPGVPCFGFRA